MCETKEVRAAEREFARKLRDENVRLKRQIAEREERDAVYFADIEVYNGKVVFYDGSAKSSALDDSLSDAVLPA